MLKSTVNFYPKLLRPVGPLKKRLYHVLRDWSPANDVIIPMDTCLDHSLIESPISEPLRLKNVLLFKKRTRLEFEKAYTSLNGPNSRNIGNDHQTLLERHNEHYKELESLLNSLKRRGVNVQMINRLEFNESLFTKADAVITAGGDGTFLQVAGWLKDNRIPIIGFNTDPARSQGALCLPVLDAEDLFERFDTGKYRYVNRQRIEVSIKADDNKIQVTDLHAPGRSAFEFLLGTLPPDPEVPGFVCLPSLALNETFVGESSSAITSYYEVGLDDAPMFKQKSSGITIATGTGSTSWYHTISAMHPNIVDSLLNVVNMVLKKNGHNPLPLDDPNFVDAVAKKFNTSIQFHPEERRLAFASRDAIVNEIYKLTLPRGFATKIRVKSRMMDGSMVVDGGVKYAFSLGTEAIFRIAPQSLALRTVSVFNARKPKVPK